MNRIHLVLDTVILVISTASTAAVNALLAQAPQADINYSAELKLLLVPLIGSMLVSGGMILLNPQPETRKIVIGRSMVALFFGLIAPQVLGFVHPAIQAIALKPIMMLAIGGASAGVGYVLSKPFCAGMYERASRVAKAELDILEKKMRGPIERETITITKETPAKKDDEPKS